MSRAVDQIAEQGAAETNPLLADAPNDATRTEAAATRFV
jgi:hypothetical protein